MPYVSRNSSGEILEIHNLPPTNNAQWLEMNDPEVVEFLHKIQTLDQAKQVLSFTDHEMIRVIEDLVDLLIEKQLFIFTELPDAVQEKLGVRKRMRKNMETLEDLVGDDSRIF